MLASSNARSEPKSSWALRAVWVLTGIAVLIFLGLHTAPTRKHGGLGDDGRIYAAVADAQRNPELAKRTLAKVERRAELAEYQADEETWAMAHLAPFCWRVLNPALCRLLPGSTHANLVWLNRSAHVLSWILLGYLLAASGASLGARAFAGLLWLSATACVRLALRQAGYIEPVTQCLWLAGLLLIVQGRFTLLPFFLGIAVLQKESLALLAPIALGAYACRWRSLGPVRPGWMLLVLLVPALSLAAVRQLVPPINTYEPLSYLLTVLGNQLFELRQTPRLPLGLLVGAGVLGLLPLAFPRAFLNFLRRDPWLVLVLGAGLLAYFGGHDKTRLLGPSLAPLTLFAAWAFDHARPRAGTSVWLVLSVALHLYLGAQWMEWTHNQPRPWRIAPGRAPLQRVHETLASLWPYALAWLVGTWTWVRFSARPSLAPLPSAQRPAS